jgi:YggT family protein
MIMDFISILLINVIRIYKFTILARVLLSWFGGNPANPIVRFVIDVTEPVLYYIRKILPRMGMIDLSPLVAFFALDFLQLRLMSALSDL